MEHRKKKVFYDAYSCTACAGATSQPSGLHFGGSRQLQPDDLLLVLEAMKMETNVTAPIAGKVKAINVHPGDAVQKDQILVEFE